MIAITKEFKQMLEELFNARGTAEIATTDIAEVLSVSLSELRTLLKDPSINGEFKIIRADDGTNYVKRFLHGHLEGTKMTSASKIKWDTIGGCPCFTCHELEKCDVGNPISSVDCPLFSKWLFAEPQCIDEEKS
ncbi:MAG: hypothetical protein FK734_16760 [Asgard group archaeon]|nr:hypothetical protein [Asgard group archaeon]